MAFKAFYHLAQTELYQLLLPFVFLHAGLLAFLFPLFMVSFHSPLVEPIINRTHSALCSSSPLWIHKSISSTEGKLNFPEGKIHLGYLLKTQIPRPHPRYMESESFFFSPVRLVQGLSFYCQLEQPLERFEKWWTWSVLHSWRSPCL